MSAGVDGISSEDRKPPPDASTEDIAKFLVTQFARNVADASTTWWQASADAFEASFCKALERAYTADDLANDTARMWTRGFKFVGDLAKFKSPASHTASRDRYGGQPGSTRA